MPFRIERNDITLVHSDAIVNTANPQPTIGSGTDSAVYTAAGAEQLLEARKAIGKIPRGQARHTPAYNLSRNGVQYIIHTVGITYKDGRQGEVDILRGCYRNSLRLARMLGCSTVAIPFLATGNYRFPKELAFQVAIEEISGFLMESEDDAEMDVILVVYDQNSLLISKRLFSDIESFIDQNYIQENQSALLGQQLHDTEWSKRLAAAHTKPQEVNPPATPPITELGPASAQEPAGRSAQTKAKILQNISVKEFLQQEVEQMNFQNLLQKLIADRNQPNKTIYKKAKINGKFFSKIISVPDYIPGKDTVMALGLALELSMEAYEDFLTRAGYSLIPAEKRDMVIKYCVLHRIYNLIEVNCILFSCGQPLFVCKD